jgi:hypothetical protein
MLISSLGPKEMLFVSTKKISNISVRHWYSYGGPYFFGETPSSQDGDYFMENPMENHHFEWVNELNILWLISWKIYENPINMNENLGVPP